jgi:hypothetical protein
MNFNKYMHIERYGTDEVDSIEIGTVYIFPKLDGTNGQVWKNDTGAICAGSRKRELSFNQDNAGFYNEIVKNEKIISFIENYPNLRLYGEWLVPHSLKTYVDTAWRKFYIFDIENMETEKLLKFEEYEPMLKKFELDYVPCIAIIKNSNEEQLYKQLEKNTFLIKDGQGFGEGIVIKNYDFINKYNSQVWAKIVTNEFKIKHNKEMGAPIFSGKENIEITIVNKYCTDVFIDKTFNKIKQIENSWSSKMIPRLLQTIYHDFVIEETWNYLRFFKNPKINFKLLQKYIINKVKEVKPEIF